MITYWFKDNSDDTLNRLQSHTHLTHYTKMATISVSAFRVTRTQHSVSDTLPHVVPEGKHMLLWKLTSFKSLKRLQS